MDEATRRSTNSVFYTFVLTDSSGKQTTGFCRRVAAATVGSQLAPDGLPVVMCILSRRPWHGAIGAVLAACEELARAQPAPGDAPLSHAAEQLAENCALYRLMAELGDIVEPSPGHAIQVELSAIPQGADGGGTRPGLPAPFCVNVDCPRSDDNPVVDVNLAYLIKPMGVGCTVRLLAALLNERRVLILGSDLTYVSCAAQAARAMLYPLEWHHAFHPLLPSHFAEYVTAPMPFIAGIHSSLLPVIQKLPIDEAVVINLDEEVGNFPHDKDIGTLPAHAASALQSDLAALLKNKSKWDNRACAAAFRRFFLRALGNYRTHLRRSFGEMGSEWGSSERADLWFDIDAMDRAHRSRTTSLFLERCRNTQAFEQFVMRRLAIATGGYREQDLWEREVSSLPAPARNADKDAGKKIGRHVDEAQRIVAERDRVRWQQEEMERQSERNRHLRSPGRADAAQPAVGQALPRREGGRIGNSPPPAHQTSARSPQGRAAVADAQANGSAGAGAGAGRVGGGSSDGKGASHSRDASAADTVGDLLSFDESGDGSGFATPSSSVAGDGGSAAFMTPTGEGGAASSDRGGAGGSPVAAAPRASGAQDDTDPFGDPPPDWDPFGTRVTVANAGDALAAALGMMDVGQASAGSGATRNGDMVAPGRAGDGTMNFLGL